MDALIGKFIKTVKELREKQTKYFRTRSPFLLTDCKNLEKKVDTMIEQIEARAGQQANMFAETEMHN